MTKQNQQRLRAAEIRFWRRGFTLHDRETNEEIREKMGIASTVASIEAQMVCHVASDEHI